MSSASLLRPFSDISARQEAFSRAYIRAVAAVAGCTVATPETDNDKVDWMISSRVRGTKFTKPQINLQAKCLLGGAAEGERISYSLDIDTYDNLRDQQVTNPRILVVVLAPIHPEDWIIQDEAQLVLKHCAYWLSLKGEPDVPNSASKTVYLPRLNIFTPKVLQAMMSRTSNGEDLAGVSGVEELK
ncbi:hypothetical protein AMC83_CH00572 [Rhizobium phaseoli]|uniref:DUF4365 domain-containing protein n=1 Tax=Rhizobium phaseoli TaxID=396 RepID=UPI0007F17E81|nr:DUF4365 domain-containing protein [Rhizobium phaseoli]ANL70606.1 hypothetical protein AMC83_CH00572 [Rhizobium phaseoli]